MIYENIIVAQLLLNYKTNSESGKNPQKYGNLVKDKIVPKVFRNVRNISTVL